MHAPELIYKIATQASFAPARSTGTFLGMPVDAKDGYMHFSTAAQLPDTLRLYFAGQDNLVLVAVRTADLSDALKWEPSRGGDLFPHLYAALPLSAVAWEMPISVSASGACELPEAVR